MLVLTKINKMNLAAYDKVNNFNPNKDYIQISYKRLVSSTIEYHDRYCLLKTYEPNNKNYNYYIAVFDNKQEGIKDKFLKKDSNGFVKVYLTDIWNSLPDYIKEKNCNVDVKLVESQNDGKVYKLLV